MSDLDRVISVNGKLLPHQSPVLPAENRGSMYGAGCFETFRADHGRILHYDLHVNRLLKGVNYLGIPAASIPEAARLYERIQELLEANELAGSEAVVRIQVSSAGPRGYHIQPNESVFLILTADAAKAVPAGEYTLYMSKISVIPSTCRPSDLKLSNTIHFLKAWRGARERGFNDALLLTTGGAVAETAVANLFWKKGETIYTPSPGCDILPGITRRSVMEVITGQTRYQLREGVFEPRHLLEAEVVWGTNTLKRIQPITRIGTSNFPSSGEFYKNLFHEFNRYREQNSR